MQRNLKIVLVEYIYTSEAVFLAFILDSVRFDTTNYRYTYAFTTNLITIHLECIFSVYTGLSQHALSGLCSILWTGLFSCHHAVTCQPLSNELLDIKEAISSSILDHSGVAHCMALGLVTERGWNSQGHVLWLVIWLKEHFRWYAFSSTQQQAIKAHEVLHNVYARMWQCANGSAYSFSTFICI